MNTPELTASRRGQDTPPSGGLGTRDVFFIVLSAAAPLMVIVGVGPIALMVGGVAAPAVYLAAGVVLTIFAVGFTTMTRYVAEAGAFYSYIMAGLGRFAGITAAVVALFSYDALVIGTFGLLGLSATSTVQDLTGVTVSWWVWALAGVGIVWYLGFRSIRFGARVLTVLLTAETCLLLLVAVSVVLRGGADGLSLRSFAPSTLFSGAAGSILPIALAAFLGFESTAIYRSEARDPRRTIPRATYLAVICLAVTYAFVLWAAVEAFPGTTVGAEAAKNPVALFFTVTRTYVGGWAVDLMHLLILTSIIASLLAFHNAISRYTVVLSGAGLLPERFARVHPRTRSPYLAGTAQTVVSLVVIVIFAVAHADPYRDLVIWVSTPGVLGVLLLQLATGVAVLVYFRRIRHGEGIWPTVVSPVLAVAGMAGGMWLTCTNLNLFTGSTGVVNGCILGAFGLAVAAGIAWATWLRIARRPVYDRLGTSGRDPVSR